MRKTEVFHASKENGSISIQDGINEEERRKPLFFVIPNRLYRPQTAGAFSMLLIAHPPTPLLRRGHMLCYPQRRHFLPPAPSLGGGVPQGTGVGICYATRKGGREQTKKRGGSLSSSSFRTVCTARKLRAVQTREETLSRKRTRFLRRKGRGGGMTWWIACAASE